MKKTLIGACLFQVRWLPAVITQYWGARAQGVAPKDH